MDKEATLGQPHPIDYCAVGHVSRDLIPGGFTVGGTVAYSSRVAQALGARTAVLTSSSADFDVAAALPNSATAVVPAPETTTFENIYRPTGRVQSLYGVAGPLTAADVPSAWRTIPLLHLAPLTNEVDFDILNAFDSQFVGITPQGWMRRWDSDGHVYAVEMAGGERILPQADAVVLSEEDLPTPDSLAYFRQHSRLLVLTMGHNGCTIFRGNTVERVTAPQVAQCNLTGAGDVFATSFFWRLYKTGDVLQAAEFANYVASQSVTQPDLESKVHLIEQLQSQG
jgi:sugar/nucleoside kinase (ribokinase family)